MIKKKIISKKIHQNAFLNLWRRCTPKQTEPSEGKSRLFNVHSVFKKARVMEVLVELRLLPLRLGLVEEIGREKDW